MPGQRNEKYYKCCPDPYLDLKYSIHLRRRGEPHYAQAQFLNRLICIAFLLSFLAPPATEHKVTLGKYGNLNDNS